MVLRERIAFLEESIQVLRSGVDVLETECDEAEEKGDDQKYELAEAKWEEQSDILETMESDLNRLNQFMQELEYAKRKK